jgi:hypothetical protein
LIKSWREAKLLAFYIDIGVAIIEWRPRTTEKKGIITKKKSVCNLRQMFCPRHDPILALVFDFLQNNRMH